MKRQTISQNTVGAERAKNCEDAEQQQIELIDGLASPAVAEFTLTGGADEHSEYCRAADAGRLQRRWRICD